MPWVAPWVTPDCADAVREQVASGFLGPGRTSQALAEAISAYVGAEHCLLTTSGTIALTVAAQAVGLNPGDEILVPAYGVVSTVNAFASAGLRPRLVDIDKRTGCITAADVADVVTERTKAVCFVDFSGYTGPELAALARFCRERNLPLIEDAAAAFGHSYGSKYAGTFGAVGVYSFSVPKVVTTGQGGALVTSDRAVYERALAYIDHGDLEWRRTNINRQIGTNLRFNDVLAALGLAQMRDLQSRLQRRREAFEVLRRGLDGYLYSVPDLEAPLHNIVFSDDPEGLVDSLRAQGIPAVLQYRTISQHPAYAHLADRPFPNADYWTRTAVYLPFGSTLGQTEAERIVEAIHNSGVPLNPIA
jgi:perosamine synthetase